MRKHTKISLKIVKGRQRLSTPLANVVLLQRDSFLAHPLLAVFFDIYFLSTVSTPLAMPPVRSMVKT